MIPFKKTARFLVHADNCWFLFWSVLFFPFGGAAESGPLGFGDPFFRSEIQTDRPDFTEGTYTVDAGHLQLESGYTFSYEDEDGVSTRKHVFPEFLLRIGLLHDLEARIVWEGYAFVQEQEDSRETEQRDGASDMSIGFKHRMYFQDGWVPDLSFLGELGLPVGSDDFSSGEIEAAGKFLWGYTLSERYSVAGNVNFSSLSGEEERYLEVASSFSLGCALTKDVGSYLEYYGLYPTQEGGEATQNYVDGGFTFRATEDLQFDIRSGFGLNSAADDFFVGVGFVCRY